MTEDNYDKVFVHFDDDITNYGLAAEVIAQTQKFKYDLEFYSSRFLYNNIDLFRKKKDLKEQSFGVYLENLQFAILELNNNEDIEKLKQIPGIAKINPDRKISIKALNPDFESEPNNWGIKRLELENAGKSGKGVKVAILDSGIDLKHPEFNSMNISQRAINFVNPGDSVQDYYGHGTHVAGIACGTKMEGLQYGVASKATLYVVKVINDIGLIRLKSWVTDGIDWALEKKCNIINLSLGYEVEEGYAVDEEFQKAVTKAREKKAIVVAAVGNGSTRVYNKSTRPFYSPIETPSNCEHAVAVSAINESSKIYRKANRSINQDQEVDFIAPGVKIFSSYPLEHNPKGYAFLDGTSMATPFISGLLALYYEGNLDKDPDEIIKLLNRNIAPLKINTLDAGNGMPTFSLKSVPTLKNQMKMSHELDYQGSVVLQNDLGLQEVYSSQNYGTFYSIYLSLECSPNPKDKNVINLTNIRFTIVNYKGILNLGIVDVKYKPKDPKGYIEFKINVRAMERNRDFPLIKGNGEPKVISINRNKVKNIRITRKLLKMNEFNPYLSPNHPNNAVFDNEFYYRDGLTFKEKTNRRMKWLGMEGIGGDSSGKRCYQITLKILD